MLFKEIKPFHWKIYYKPFHSLSYTMYMLNLIANLFGISFIQERNTAACSETCSTEALF